MAIIIKSKEELAIMRQAGRITAEILALLASKVKPGVTTLDLDRIAREQIEKRGVKSSFLNYQGFPATLCAAVNEEVVHGIPDRKHVLREGDIIGIDFGAIYKGYHGDAAVTVPVGQISAAARRLVQVTREALDKGIEAAKAGRYVGDISSAIQNYVESRGYNVVRQFVGHGVGRAMHEEPQVPNFGNSSRGPRLRPGMTLAIEPMVNIGGSECVVLHDKWTVVTADRSLSAHFEHTIAITENGPEVLTRLE